MRYEGPIYRPPSEAYSLLIQASIGCPYNKCTFCAMYKGTKFRLRAVDEIKEDLLAARHYYGENIKSLFFPDGNTIIMPTKQLINIINYARRLFPYLQRITVYGSSRFVDRKSNEELEQLKQAGLTRIHTGMESGDDLTLKNIKKGTNSKQIISAGLKLKKAGIEGSLYYLTGIGGVERSDDHALNSARTLSAISPEFIRIRTFVPAPGSPLYEDCRRGIFTVLDARQALRELRIMVANLECENSLLLSDHINNYWNVEGKLPADRAKMLASIDQALTLDPSALRPLRSGRL